MSAQIFQYDTRYRDDLEALLHAYLDELAVAVRAPPWNHDLDTARALDFTLNGLDKFAPPDGRLLLIEWDGAVAGMISLRRIRADAGEIKRMFVLPEFRSKRLGKQLVDAALAAAHDIGYRQVFLDTAACMPAALALYKKLGFRETAPYPESTVAQDLAPNWIYLVKDLG